MKRIIEAENIKQDISLINAKRKHQERKAKKICNYRLYTINKSVYTAKGYWIDKGKLYKDKINFKYYHDYTKAKVQAEKILNTTSELCVSIEDVKKNILYIVYKNKTQVLRVKYTHKAITKRKALKRAYKLINANGGCTIEKSSGIYKITSYK